MPFEINGQTNDSVADHQAEEEPVEELGTQEGVVVNAPGPGHTQSWTLQLGLPSWHYTRRREKTRGGQGVATLPGHNAEEAIHIVPGSGPEDEEPQDVCDDKIFVIFFCY